MVIFDSTLYTIEVSRAVYEHLLCEASYARLVNQFRRGSLKKLIGELMTFIVPG